MTRRIVGIVQARMGSTRLPGKVLLQIASEPMLARVVARLSSATHLNHIVVATSIRIEDDPIAEMCRERGVDCYRGHPTDLLDRYFQAAAERQAEVVVRITGDCPLIDPDLVDELIRIFLRADPPLDFAANRLPGDRTYPIGLDTEVCTFDALQRAWREAVQPYQREHVMPYLYEEPDRFRTLLVHAKRDLSGYRWTVDAPEDLEFVREVYAWFSPRTDFSWLEVLDLVQDHPELAAINAAVPHRSERDVDPEFEAHGGEPP